MLSYRTTLSSGTSYLYDTITISYVDSPATTSATTYKLQLKTNGSGETSRINSSGTASLILQEVLV
jgi:hypothetical protein